MEIISPTKRWVVCLKHGPKYSVDYVNRLHNMVKRNLSFSFGFACITEDPAGLHSEITHIPTPPYELSGWWFKVWALSNEIPIDGEIMFIDLDMVIINKIDSLWECHLNRFCIIRDFRRAFAPNHKGFNSSLFRFPSGQYSYIWNQLKKDFKQTKLYHGDQDFLDKYLVKDYEYFPDNWIQSYKWETKKTGINSDVKVLAFHGKPKPADIYDDIVTNNWR